MFSKSISLLSCLSERLLRLPSLSLSFLIGLLIAPLVIASESAFACDAVLGLNIEMGSTFETAPNNQTLEDFLNSELKEFELDGNDVCSKPIRFLPPINQENDFEVESFRLSAKDDGWQIEAATPTGYLRGFYHLLDMFGVIFVSANHTIVPDSLLPETNDTFGKIISPIIDHRALWAFGEALEPEFLEWAARSGYNVIGGRFKDTKPEYYERFKIKRWAGGHNVISTLSPSHLKHLDGSTLIERHPEWYGQAGGWRGLIDRLIGRVSENPIPLAAESYQNPCFGNLEYAEFFAQALIEAALTGEYHDTDILNLWPSDRPSMRTSRHCKRAPGSKSASDDFTFFLNHITQAISRSKRIQEAGRKLTIAGIGYYGSYDLSKANILMDSQAGDTSEHLHIFYNNVRSYAAPLSDQSNQINDRLQLKMDDTIKHHNLTDTGFGAVEYFNYSLYRGMVSPHGNILSSDINALAKKGLSFWGYMHPSLSPSPFHASADYSAAKALLGTRVSKTSRDHFARTYAGPAAIDIFERYENAMKETSEIIGPESSLWLVIQADRRWKKPILSNKQITAATHLLLNGGSAPLPPIRLKGWPATEYRGDGLLSMLKQLHSLETEIEKLIVNPNEKWTTNLKAMKNEVSRSKGVLSMVAAAAKQRLASDAQDCHHQATQYRAALDLVSALDWPKKLYDKTSGNADLDYFETVYTDDIKPFCEGF